jgi:hypothetical protein
MEVDQQVSLQPNDSRVSCAEARPEPGQADSLYPACGRIPLVPKEWR